MAGVLNYIFFPPAGNQEAVYGAALDHANFLLLVHVPCPLDLASIGDSYGNYHCPESHSDEFPPQVPSPSYHSHSVANDKQEAHSPLPDLD